MDLSVRSTMSESMDGELDAQVYARCLRELGQVNRLTMTHSSTLGWLGERVAPGSEVSVLDVGCGHGDLLRAIARWARRNNVTAHLSGLDLHPGSALAARAATPAWMGIEYRTGDVFAFEPEERPDFVVTSQCTHHLADGDVVRFLEWADATAVRGWHVADLHRHRVPFYAFPVLCRVARWHRIVREDGQISIARAFRRGDWVRYLAEAGVSGRVRWCFPFRLCVMSAR